MNKQYSYRNLFLRLTSYDLVYFTTWMPNTSDTNETSATWVRSSRKMRLRPQVSSEQVDDQSRPQVSREMLPVLEMSIHCHASVYITCQEIPAENYQSEWHFYNEDKNKQVHSQIKIHWQNITKIENTKSWSAKYQRINIKPMKTKTIKYTLSDCNGTRTHKTYMTW